MDWFEKIGNQIDLLVEEHQKPDWDGEGAEVLSVEIALIAKTLLQKLCYDGITLEPDIYPSNDGSIGVDWHYFGTYVSLGWDKDHFFACVLIISDEKTNWVIKNVSTGNGYIELLNVLRDFESEIEP